MIYVVRDSILGFHGPEVPKFEPIGCAINQNDKTRR